MTTTEEAPAAPPGTVDDEDLYVPTAWEFVTEPPTTEQVVDKLATLKAWFGGIRPEEYVEFVQPLPQNKNVSREKGVKDYREVWTLYMSVAGRIAALNDAAERNDWRVDFEPEPNVPEGLAHGFVVMNDERIVYREHCCIHKSQVIVVGQVTSNDWLLLGRKSGTAWVPATGGAQAVASNRWEKVETSARGRSIAAWGIGILPGSGVASLDEMRDAPLLGQAEIASGGARRRRREAPSRDGMEAELRETLVEYQQVTDIELEQVDEKVKAFVRASFGKEVERSDDGPFDLSVLKPGELGLLLNQMKRGVAKARAEDPGVI